MLKNTFIHIPGIGIQTEQQFWESEIQHLNIKNTSFYENRLHEPVLPENPFEVDRMVVEKIKGEMGFGDGNFLSSRNVPSPFRIPIYLIDLRLVSD